MKVKVDSCVYDVGYIDIERMSVTHTNRSHFQTTVKLDKCEILSENFIDDLAIEHVKNIMDAKEKTKDSLSDAEFASAVMNNTMNKMDNNKLTDSKNLEEKNTWDVGEGCEESDVVTVEIVDSVGGMNFTSDGTISQKVTDNKNTEDDVVNNPKHYQIGLGEYEMKDVSYALINHNKLDGREGAVYFNVLKYIGRFNNKGVPIQDLEKAEFYLKELIELTKEKDY